MNVKIGIIIKKLRAEKNITQDALATAIGVTPQAISRWENESGYPDIELLPLLADFFKVSIDELLGYKFSQREQELIDIKKEIKRLDEVGTHQENLKFARTAFAKFPNDAEIKVYLADCLSDEYNITKEDALYQEAETLCLSVVNECRDEDIRYEAILTLKTIYINLDKPEKVKSLLDLLSPIKYCREMFLANGIGDGNTELYRQDEIDKLTDSLGLALSFYAFDDSPQNDPNTWNKKIEVLSLSNLLYKMIYGENLMFYHNRLSQNYWLISTYQLALGKIDETFESLEAMCYHAIEYDKSYINDHGKYFTSIITNKLVYPKQSQDFHELTEYTECYRILEKLAHERYDYICQNPRFIEIVKKLNQYA